MVHTWNQNTPACPVNGAAGLAKRTIRLILAVLFCLTLLSLGALAEEDDNAAAFVEATEAAVPEDEAASAPEDDGSEAIAQEEAAGDSGEPAENRVEEDPASETPESDGAPSAPDGCDDAIITEEAEQTATNSGIDPLSASGDALSTAETGTDITLSVQIESVGEEPADNAECAVISKDYSLKNGRYSFQYVMKTTGELTFDNDLEISYQGVNGRYQLHYEIIEPDSHIMTVTGTFDNIISASPLMGKVRDRVSEDSYFYQLALRTKEGFSFANKLTFLFDGKGYDYSLRYSYDLLTDSQTLDISGFPARRTFTVFR